METKMFDEFLIYQYKMKYLLLLLFIIICITCLFPKYETFESNDYYSRYLNDISVPSEFYFQGKVAHGLNTFELKDKFFIDALESNLDKNIMLKNTIQPTNALDRINKFLEKLLNTRLTSEETNLFAVVFGEITSIKDNLYDSKHIVHRNGKVYGVSIELTTFITNDNIYLKGYKLVGFVFDDRLNNQQAYNLDQNKNQYFKQDKPFTKDEKYIKNYLCQYYKDIEKFKGIKISTDLECSTNHILRDRYHNPHHCL